MKIASFNRRRCHVAILFLLVASVIGSSSGQSLRSMMKTSAATPANRVDNSTETVEQYETLSAVNSTVNATQPLSEMPEQKNTNISRSVDRASSPLPRFKPENQFQQAVSKPLHRKKEFTASPHRNPNWATSTPSPSVLDEETETEEDGTINTEDLLAPIPESASLLAQLMSLSMQNLDTVFRGSLRNQSPIVQYSHSFRTTLLQISQKLNNAFLVCSTNADKMKMHSLFVPSKVKEATGYLEKFNNSSRMVEFLYLPLKNLKETTDQTLNLSNQIANQFGELVQLVDEVIKSHNSFKSNKEQQVRNTSTELYWANQEKQRMEQEIISFEYGIKDLKEQRQWHESAFHYALEDLKQLQSKATDESQCYWKYNWDWRATYTWVCPHHPDPSQIRQANQTAKTAQKKLEETMKLLSAKEEKAAEKREVYNELKIRIERLNHEMHQINEDVQLLGNTSTPLRSLRISFKKLDKSWNKFLAICGNFQSGATKSLDVIKEANRTSTLWNNQLSENILLNLNKTNEDLSLVKAVIDIYLEGSNIEIIREIVAEVEQMLTMRGNIRELESHLQAKCDVASREIKNLLERNQRQTEPQLSKLIKTGKDKLFEK